MGSESKTLLRRKAYPLPLSFTWRVTHFLPYIIGGTTFFAGSLCYFTEGNSLARNYDLGGYLFTIGSIGFLFADIFEWSRNNRVGCIDSSEERADWDKKANSGATRGSSLLSSCDSSLRRPENGINFAYSAFGSFLYLIGSILFIPSTNAIVAGTEIFIAGSFVIFTSQAWKLYRYESFADDVPAVNVDLWAGIGGLLYGVGSIQFLPAYDLTDNDTNNAAIWFTLGGAAFTFSGISIFYRYFVVSPPMYETD